MRDDSESAPLQWQKSTFSGGGSGEDCVELAAAQGGRAIWLRESDSPATALTTTRTALQALLGAVKAGSAMT
ncbi:DUF397 domain-containing protein [Streptomyces sp. NBC_01304]|uniref:DUF397 domain-containing protein n=1 Tax=Streptomyces sp. NBC_01304 TaxID=2903818 RepID=UPI002E1478AE|nr:DUF397 domain-containing protein [Streptomyces sp. NBC_01304]